MTRQVSKQKSIFPNIPRSTQAVDEKGHLTPQWSLAFNTLFETLQSFFSNEGFGLPTLTQEEQDTIEQTYAQFVGSVLPPGVDDISGFRIMDAPKYGSTRSPKVFIIDYNSDRTISSAEWKTYTVT